MWSAANNKKTDISPIPLLDYRISKHLKRTRLNSRRDTICFRQINRMKLRPHNVRWDTRSIRDAGNHINRIFMCSITFYTLIFAIKIPNTFSDPIECTTISHFTSIYLARLFDFAKCIHRQVCVSSGYLK